MNVLLVVCGLAAFAILTLGTALAVAAEFSLTTLERSTVDADVKHVGDRRSVAVQRAHRTLALQLSGAQLAITITTLISGYLAEPIFGHLLTPVLTATGMSEAAVDATALTLAMLIATALSMVLGEMVPKYLAIARPLPTARAVAGYHAGFSRLFRWMITLMNNSANVVVKRMGIEPAEELRSARSPAELGSIVRASAEHGTLDTTTATLLDRSLRFGDRTADELMTPRTRIKSLAPSDSVSDLLELARESGFSRFPVCAGDLDDIAGTIHVKQAFTVPAAERRTTKVGSLMRPIPTVPESLSGDALLNRLRDSSFQLAVVVDEYGGTAGLVTLEDVVEEIIGDVRDEHDDAEAPASQRTGTDSWVVSGQLRPDEVADATGFVMPDGDYETVAGLVLATLGEIPAPGDTVDVDGWKLTVSSMERRRIAEVAVQRVGGPLR